MEQQIEITDEFQRTIDIFDAGRNIFLTGRAGTGKSTLLKILKKRCPLNLAVCAPTGIAALNVGGQTIHSLFCLGAGHVSLEKLQKEAEIDELKIRNAVRKLEVLVVDEVSMVRADVMTGLDFILKQAKCSTLPFGGIQVLLIGDPYQLPPVVRDDEAEHFAQYHESAHFFRCQAYLKADFHTIELTKVHRQKDQSFIDVLNEIREGRLTPEGKTLLDAHVHVGREWVPGALFLTSTNALADKVNAVKLGRLPGPERSFWGNYEGNFNRKHAPAPLDLLLRIGAQVMLLRNDKAGAYVNGSLATVKSFNADGFPVVELAGSGTEITVQKESWDTVGYEYDKAAGRVVEKVTGSYRQLPLMLAWACTIHKSQGKTLDHAYVHLGNGAFAAGQLYVALSRVRTPQGLYLQRPVSAEDVITDLEVQEFMRNINNPQGRVAC